MKSDTVSCEEHIEQNLIENYNRYYHLAYSYVKNEPDAMDVVQEAAYKAIYKSDTLHNPNYAGTWICRIVTNEAYNCFEKRKRKMTSRRNWRYSMKMFTQTWICARRSGS